MNSETFYEDTKNDSEDQKKMLGLAVILFASKKGEPAVDVPFDA